MAIAASAGAVGRHMPGAGRVVNIAGASWPWPGARRPVTSRAARSPNATPPVSAAPSGNPASDVTDTVSGPIAFQPETTDASSAGPVAVIAFAVPANSEAASTTATP